MIHCTSLRLFLINVADVFFFFHPESFSTHCCPSLLYLLNGISNRVKGSRAPFASSLLPRLASLILQAMSQRLFGNVLCLTLFIPHTLSHCLTNEGLFAVWLMTDNKYGFDRTMNGLCAREGVRSDLLN